MFIYRAFLFIKKKLSQLRNSFYTFLDCIILLGELLQKDKHLRKYHILYINLD